MSSTAQLAKGRTEMLYGVKRRMVLPQFAALSGTSTPQLLPPPPPNGTIVHTDSVRMKANIQNSETCMRNLHW